MQKDIIIAPSRIEPIRLEDGTPESVFELSHKLATKAATLGGNLPARTLTDLAGVVRIMNSYYSNKIEGHNTLPRDIERALRGDFDDDPSRRAMQFEAAQHVRLQAEIDETASRGKLHDPAGADFIRHLHREFYRGAAPEFLRLDDGSDLVPGEWREIDVKVGLHIPPPYEYVPMFMRHFYNRLRQDHLAGLAKIHSIPTAHHRLNYIHPFADGNGRVSRLVSHAMAHHAGIAAGGLWSVSRGLARGLGGGLEGRQQYKQKMQLADRERQGDRDGRGNLSLAALVSFVQWFLEVCIDQVDFMSNLFDLQGLGTRYDKWADARNMRKETAQVLRILLLRGEVARGQVSTLIGKHPRTARTLISGLVKEGIVGSDTPKGPISLRFPTNTHDELFPRLFV